MNTELTKPEPPTFLTVIALAKELNLPVAILTPLLDLIGRREIVIGLWSQGETKFKETLSIFSEIGIGKCSKYIEILNDVQVIGRVHISQDCARAPYSIARVLQFLNDRELEIDDLHYIIPRLKESIGERSFERGFPSWSLYYFLVTLKKIKTIGVDRFFSVIFMLKEMIGQEHLCKAYEQGYLWFVEAMELFSQLGIKRSRDLIEDFKYRSNPHYFTTSFAHNPRSFARYIRGKSILPVQKNMITIAGKAIADDDIISLTHDLLGRHFDKRQYFSLPPSEFVALVFDAVNKYLEGNKNDAISIFLRKKYFSALSKGNVYSLLREIGPEIEIQKGLDTYDVDTAHMVAFFFLVQSSGDALIEFPLGPAHYHGSLSEIIRTMGKIKIGQESLIPINKMIPLDVSLSMPRGIISKNKFQKKATLLRVVNDLLYTADIRLSSAFQGEPMDQSGVRFKAGQAIIVGSIGPDLVENRSGNIITDNLEYSVENSLFSHEASFEFYQIMYSALAAHSSEESKATELDNKLAALFLDFENQVLDILKKENIEYLAEITSNENLAFEEISHARKKNKNITVRLKDTVQHFLSLMNQEVLKEAIQKRMEQLKSIEKDVESVIKAEIRLQNDIDEIYGKTLKEALQKL